MFKLTVGGRSVRPDQFADEMMKEMFKRFTAELRERFSAIRHPETGEFPTVIVLGHSLDDCSIRVEGTDALLAVVREKVSAEDLEGMELRATDKPIAAPKAFLSYAGEDAEEAERIARALIAKGIDTWWAGWSLSAGDSIRQKIDGGLEECTHFIVLLTPASLDKPWVKTEIDAGFVGKVEARCRFIPLRKGVSIEELTPLLRTLVSPSLDGEFGATINQLVNDIHGVTKKPPLGAAPQIVARHEGYSHAANLIAQYFVGKTATATSMDPQSNIGELSRELGLTDEDVRDALHELRPFFRKIEFDRAFPLDALFVEFDKTFTDHDPAEDGLKLAFDLTNDPDFPVHADQIAERYGWTPRRLNPAIAYLFQRGLIHDRYVLASRPWIMLRVDRDADAMRRFVKSRT